MGRIRPQVAYGNGSFVVSGGISISLQMGGVGGAEMLRPQGGTLDAATRESTTAESVSYTHLPPRE